MLLPSRQARGVALFPPSALRTLELHHVSLFPRLYALCPHKSFGVGECHCGHLRNRLSFPQHLQVGLLDYVGTRLRKEGKAAAEDVDYTENEGGRKGGWAWEAEKSKEGEVWVCVCVCGPSLWKTEKTRAKRGEGRAQDHRQEALRKTPRKRNEEPTSGTTRWNAYAPTCVFPSMIKVTSK